jgi:hypothetical protein
VAEFSGRVALIEQTPKPSVICLKFSDTIGFNVGCHVKVLTGIGSSAFKDRPDTGDQQGQHLQLIEIMNLKTSV